MKNGNGAQPPIPQSKPAVEPGLTFDRAAVLAGTVATPFLVLSPTKIQQSIRTLRTCLPGVELFYAMKSNPDPELLGMLSGLVDGIDVASYPEVALAAAAGIAPERLFHSHPIKKDTDIAACVRHGVQWFTYDNAADRLAPLAAPITTREASLALPAAASGASAPEFVMVRLRTVAPGHPRWHTAVDVYLRHGREVVGVDREI